ncbi:MAG: outer membrane beta-barrel protein [Bacteroidales bacterium]|jgi:hypothetical protein
MSRIFTLAAIVFVLTSFSLQTMAQTEVSGQVKDSGTKDVLPFCNVSAFNQKDSLLAGGITDDNGYFKIPLNPGAYRLIISFVGYKTDTLQLAVGAENKFLGIIRLEPGEALLGEVLVTGATRGYTIDKDVQMVTAKMREGSTNTLEVLERMNGLAYDRYNRAIKVDGDTHVIMLVNGLEKNQEYIKNLAPDRIKEVEIMRSPGGRYALEGYTAVINIILKSDYRGTEISALENGLLDPDTKVNRPFPINYANLTFNYTYDKVNFYVKGNSTFNTFRIYGTTDQDYANGYSLKSRPLDPVGNLVVKGFNNSYTAGLDYYMNPRHTLSFESTISAFPAKQSTIQDFNITQYMNDSLIEQYTSHTTNLTDTRDITNSLFYIFNISDATKLNAEFTYNRYDDSYTNSLLQSNGFERNEKGSNHKDFTKFYVELSHTINAKSTVMAGYGNTWRNLQNNYSTGTRLLPSDGLMNDTTSFGMSELRHKLYAYYSLSLNNKLSFKVGAAAEYSRPITAETDHTYLIYQPYLDFNIAVHKMLDIKLKYRADSEYPTILQVTPFTQVLDQYTTQKGNPNLRPELTHTVSARMRVMQGLLSVEPYYGFSNNRINRVVNPLGGNLIEFVYENVGHFTSRGIKGDLTIPLFKQSLIIKTDFDFFHQSITYQERKNSINDWTMNAQLLYIGKKYHTVGGLIFQNGLKKVINAQGYDLVNNDLWLMFVQQPLFKNSLTVMVGYILPMNFLSNYNQGSYTDTGLYAMTSLYNIDMLKNMVLVNITYRFNQGKSRNIEKEVKTEVERKAKKLF